MYNSSSNSSQSKDHVFHALRMFNLTLLTIISLTSWVGNFTIIVAQLRRSRTTSTDYLVLALAFVDFLTGFVLVPTKAVIFLPIDWDSATTDVLCRIERYSLYVSGMCMTTLLSATAVDRYIKVCKPLTRCITATRAKYYSIGVVVASVVVGVPCTLDVLHLSGYVCTPHGNMAMHFTETIFIVLLTILFITTSIAYLLVAKKIRQRMKVKPTSKSNLPAISPKFSFDGKDIFSKTHGNVHRMKKLTCIVNPSSEFSLKDITKSAILQRRQTVGTRIGNVCKETHSLVPSRHLLSVKALTPSPSTPAALRNRWMIAGKAAVVLFFISIVSSTSWTMSICASRLPLSQHAYVNVLRKMLTEFHLVNCVVYPVLVLWLSSDLRQDVKDMLCKWKNTVQTVK
ncbi:hypothetical protein DPMN_007304 [Dreissena polymorpha]|uniref:G-protein coupled receptors family 1 profile domain-containing protein n=1 Tax=Dreissena polymorpha TaxID=45954 RepID=A0A9D4RWA7_DREPO|nr:hypothetical protein DPMN_007304 [Dreissena polymorpha]